MNDSSLINKLKYKSDEEDCLDVVLLGELLELGNINMWRDSSGVFVMSSSFVATLIVVAVSSAVDIVVFEFGSFVVVVTHL